MPLNLSGVSFCPVKLTRLFGSLYSSIFSIRFGRDRLWNLLQASYQQELHISVESVIHTDNDRGYNDLVNIGGSKYQRVQHGHNEFANGSR